MPATGRSTRQKRAIAALLESGDHFRSAQDIYAHLRAAGEPVGLTTIYHQLRGLADAGEIDAVRTSGGETLYRRCGSEAHHHHVVCRQCGASVEVEGPEIEAWAERVARRTGYSDVAHTVELMGLCPACGR